MPTKREREYYRMGFADGQRSVMSEGPSILPTLGQYQESISRPTRGIIGAQKRKRKLSAWNKFVKANSKKPRFRYRNGKLNLKKMAIAFRKTPAGRKKRR